MQAAGLATQAASLASEVNAVAEQASLSFSKKTWTDTATSGTPITAAELNRLENAISSLTTAVNNLQDSVSVKVLYNNAQWRIYTVSNYVYVHIQDVRTDSADSWAYVQCNYVLPEQYRPSVTLQFPLVTGNGASWTGCAKVQNSGNMYVINYGNSGSIDARCGIMLFPIGI